jgi:prepilin-type N-terminal cleavage/methylation domain-containing protein/prepilin-type processing-associated H-X9-DG protein
MPSRLSILRHLIPSNIGIRVKGAFTLIELLVVIAIICILAALVMPSFRTAQEASRTIKCASNLKQIGAAMFLYTQDHSERFPESSIATVQWGATDPATHQLPWMQQIATYVGNATDPAQMSQATTIFTCPSSSYALAADKYYSYFNGCHSAYLLSGSATAVRKQSISVPAEEILSGDVTNPNVGGQMDADKNDYTVNPISTQLAIHNGSVNILYYDGHVAAARWMTTGTSQGYFDPSRMAITGTGVGAVY